MKEVSFSLILISMFYIVDVAHIRIAGNVNPFGDENQSEINRSRPIVNLPSHDYVPQSAENDEALLTSNNNQLEKAGPSLDIIDSHPHDHDHDDNSSLIETAKHFLIQPSIDFLDAQLHSGKEHIHDSQNETDNVAADLNDFQRWLKEQNQTDQLNRFLLLQKEMTHFHLDDSRQLNDKLNRTIEEMKLVAEQKQGAKHEL